MKESLTRTITGIVFIAVIISSLLLHHLSYLILFSIVLSLAWIEYIQLISNRISGLTGISGIILLVASFGTSYYLMSGGLARPFWLLPLASPILLLILYLISVRPVPGAGIWYTLSGYIFLMLVFACLNSLVLYGETGYHPRWVLFTFAFLWINDTMAYVTGRLAGRHKIWPAISPGKTWEGSIGGAVSSLLLAFVLAGYYPDLTYWQWIVFAAMIVITGSFGDFLESWLKRRAGVKDSGRILPGHGGVLDRFDSFLLAIPSAGIFLYLLK